MDRVFSFFFFFFNSVQDFHMDFFLNDSRCSGSIRGGN